MTTLGDILSALRRERARLFATYGLKSMALFGSATRNDLGSASDVDIMVEFNRPIGIEFVELADESPPRRVCASRPCGTRFAPR
ncbi:MAG: nucleotidyltransferase domain-containing protein [Flavobacteriales bacterium]|nr:nucleotidyltransferase domain-containing protein [Flavobacteriales bacterium]